VNSQRSCDIDRDDSPARGSKTEHVALDLENSPRITRGDHIGVVGNDPVHYEARVMMKSLNNKVNSHRPCGFDSDDSPQGVQRRIMEIDLENSPGITRGDHIGVVRNGPKDLGHYEVYTVSRSLGGLGVALIDTGTPSFISESSVTC
jgi:hypothetical protein